MEQSHSSSEGNLCNQVFPSTSREDGLIKEKRRLIRDLTKVRSDLIKQREEANRKVLEDETEGLPACGSSFEQRNEQESDEELQDESEYEEATEGEQDASDYCEKNFVLERKGTETSQVNSVEEDKIPKEEPESTSKSSEVTSTPDGETDITTDENVPEINQVEAEEKVASEDEESEQETEFIYEDEIDSSSENDENKQKSYFPLIIEDPFSNAHPSMRYLSNKWIELFHGDRNGTFEVLRVKNGIELDYDPDHRLIFTCIDKESEDEVTTAAFLDSQRFSIYGTLEGHINMLRVTANDGQVMPNFYERKHIYSVPKHPVIHTAINNIDAGFICATYQNKENYREQLIVLDLVRQLNIMNPTTLATYDLNQKETFLDVKWSWYDSSNLILSLSNSLRVIDLRVDTNLARTLFIPFSCPIVAPSKFREEFFAAIGKDGDKHSIMLFDVRKLTCPLAEYKLLPEIEKDGIDTILWHPLNPFDLMYSSRKHSFIGTISTQSCQTFATMSMKDKGESGRHKRMSGSRVWDLHLQDEMYKYEEEKFRNSYYPISENIVSILGYGDQYTEAQNNGKELPLILNLPTNWDVHRQQEDFIIETDNADKSDREDTFSSEEEFAASVCDELNLSIAKSIDLPEGAEDWSDQQIHAYMLEEMEKNGQATPDEDLDSDDILFAQLLAKDVSPEEEDEYYANLVRTLRKKQQAEMAAIKEELLAEQAQIEESLKVKNPEVAKLEDEPELLVEIPSTSESVDYQQEEKEQINFETDPTEAQYNSEPWKSQEPFAILPMRPRANVLDRTKLICPPPQPKPPVIPEVEEKESSVPISPSVYGSPLEELYPAIDQSDTDLPPTSQIPGNSSVFGTPDQPESSGYEQESPSVDLPGTSSMYQIDSFSPDAEEDDHPWYEASSIGYDEPGPSDQQLIDELKALKMKMNKPFDPVASIDNVLKILKKHDADRESDYQLGSLRQDLSISPTQMDEYLSELATKFDEDGNPIPLDTIEEEEEYMFQSLADMRSMGSSVTTISSTDDLENSKAELLEILYKKRRREPEEERWIDGSERRKFFDAEEISNQTGFMTTVGDLIDDGMEAVKGGLRRLSNAGSNLFGKKKTNEVVYFDKPDFDFMKGMRLEKLEIDPKIYLRLNRITPAKFNKYNYRFLRSATNPLLLDSDLLGSLCTRKSLPDSEHSDDPLEIGNQYKCIWNLESESGIYGIWDPMKVLKLLKVNKKLRLKVLRMLETILPPGACVSFETLQIIGKFINNQLQRMYFERSDYEKQYGNLIKNNKIHGFETTQSVITFAIPPNGLKGVLYATNCDDGRILYSPPAILEPEEYTTWQFSRTLEKARIFEIHSTTDINTFLRLYDTIACWQKSPLLFDHQDYLLSLEMRDTQEEKKHERRKAALEGDSDCSEDEKIESDSNSIDSYIKTVRKLPPLVYHAGEWVYWTRKSLDFYEGPIESKFLKKLLVEYKRIWKYKLKQRRAENKAAMAIADRLQKEAMMKEMERREAELKRLNLFSPRNSYARLSSPRLQEANKEKEYQADDEVAGDFMVEGMDRDEEEEEDEERISFGTPDDRSRESTSRSVATTAGSTPYGTPKDKRSAHHSKRGSLTNPSGTPEEIGSYGHRKRSRPIPIGSLYADIAQEYTGKTPQELMDEAETEGLSFKRLFDSPKSGDKRTLLTPEGRSPRNVAEDVAAKKRYNEEQAARNSSEAKASATSPYSESESEKLAIGSSLEKSDHEQEPVPTKEVFQISKKSNEIESVSLSEFFGLCEKEATSDYLKVLDKMKRMESEGGEMSDKTVEEEDFPDNDTPTKEKIPESSRNLSSLRSNLFGENSESATTDYMPKRNVLPIPAKFAGKISPLAQYDKSGVISGKGIKSTVIVTKPEGSRKKSSQLPAVPEKREKEKNRKKKSKSRKSKKEVKPEPEPRHKVSIQAKVVPDQEAIDDSIEPYTRKRMGRLEQFLTTTGKKIEEQLVRNQRPQVPPKSSSEESYVSEEEPEEKIEEHFLKDKVKGVDKSKSPEKKHYGNIPSPPDARRVLNAAAEAVRKLVQSMSSEEIEEVPTLQPKCFEGRDNYRINPKDYPGLANPSGPPIGLVELRSKPMLEPMPDPEKPETRQRVYSSVMAKPTPKEPEPIAEMRPRVYSDVSFHSTMHRKYGVSELAKPKLEDLLSASDIIQTTSDEPGTSQETISFGKGTRNHVFVDLPPPKPPSIMKKKKPKTPKTPKLQPFTFPSSPMKTQYAPWTFCSRPQDVSKIEVEIVQETFPRKPSPELPAPAVLLVPTTSSAPQKLPEFETIYGVPNVPPQPGYSVAPDKKRTKIYADSDEKYEALRTDAPGKFQELTYEMAGMEEPKKKPLDTEELKHAAMNLIKHFAPPKPPPAKQPDGPQRKLSNIMEKPESPDDQESRKNSRNLSSPELEVCVSFSYVPPLAQEENNERILRLKDKCPVDQDDYEDYHSPYPAKYNADSLLYRTRLELDKYERQQRAGYDLSLECHNVKSYLRDMSQYSKDALDPYTPDKIEEVDQTFYYEEVEPPKPKIVIPVQYIPSVASEPVIEFEEQEVNEEEELNAEGTLDYERRKKSRKEFTARAKKSESTQSESIEQGNGNPSIEFKLDYDFAKRSKQDTGFKPSDKNYSEDFESLPPSGNEADLEDILQLAEKQPRKQDEHALLLNILFKERIDKRQKKTIKKQPPKAAPKPRRRPEPQKDMSLRSAGFITLDSDDDQPSSSHYYEPKLSTSNPIIKTSKKEVDNRESIREERIKPFRLNSVIQRTIESESEIEDMIIVNKKPKLKRLKKPKPKPWADFQKYLYPLPVNRYCLKYKIKRGEMDFTVKGVPGMLQLMIHESDNDFDIQDLPLDTTSFIHIKMYVGPYRERILYGYHLAHQDHEREYIDPETEYGFFSRMFICFMQGKINEFLTITERLYDWVTSLPEQERRDELIPFVVKMVYVYQDFCDYIHHYRGTEDEHLKSETEVTKNEFLRKLDQISIDCMDFFEENPILQVIFLLMKLEVVEQEQPDAYAEFFVGVKNFPTRLLVLFICRVCTTATLKRILPQIFAQLEGIDRLPFVGIGHHYDTYAVLADYYDKTGDFQQVAHCLIAGRTLEEEDYYVRFLYKLMGYEDWDMEKPVNIEPEFRTEEMPDHLFEYPYHIDIFRLEDFLCFDSEDPEHPFNQLCRLWKRDSPGGFGRLLAYLGTKGRIPPVYYSNEIYKDSYVVSTETFETYYEICQQAFTKYLHYLNAVDPTTQYCIYEEVFNHGFRDTEVESTAVYRRLLIERTGNNAIQSIEYPGLQIMPACDYCGKSRKEAEIIRKKADEEELQKLQEAERTGKGRRKIEGEEMEIEPAPGVDDMHGSMLCSEMEAKAYPIAACQNCRKPSPRCTICHSIEGVVYDADLDRFDGLEDHWVFCPRCQHGGHAVHLSEWFGKQKKCASPNCNCECNRTDVFLQLVKWDMEDKGYLPATDFNY